MQHVQFSPALQAQGANSLRTPSRTFGEKPKTEKLPAAHADARPANMSTTLAARARKIPTNATGTVTLTYTPGLLSQEAGPSGVTQEVQAAWVTGLRVSGLGLS